MKNKDKILELWKTGESSNMELAVNLAKGNGFSLEELFPEKISLSYLNLEIIPDFVFELTQLKKIYLYNNEITEIPKEISKLVNLESLWLGNNKLTELPKEITNLVKVNRFNLRKNQFCT